MLDDGEKSVNEVEDVPKGFKDWVEKNQGRIDKAEANGTVPYFIADNRKCVEDILKKDNDSDDSVTIKIGDRTWTLKELISECTVEKTENGKIYLHPEHGKTEKAENLDFARWRAEHFNEEMILLPNPPHVTSADSYNITRGVIEEYKLNIKATKSSIDNLIRSGKKQADYIILQIESEISVDELSDAIQDRVGRAENLKEMRIRVGNAEAVYSRKYIISHGFKIKPGDFHIVTVSRIRGTWLASEEVDSITDAKLRKFFGFAK